MTLEELAVEKRGLEKRRACALFAALVSSALAASGAAAEKVVYKLTVDNTWSETTHPGAFPPNAHFSWIGGGTHDATVSFWSEGVPTSPGMTRMAETGVTHDLVAEVDLAIAAGSAGSSIEWTHWFCPPDTTSSNCGPLEVLFDVTDDHARVTFVSMLGPTPDWFIGVSGLPLRDESGWLETVVVDLRPYDGGTRSANAWALFGPENVPPEPVSLITAASGQLVGPGSLGTFTFQLLTPQVPALGPRGLAPLAAALATFGAAGVRARSPHWRRSERCD